MKLMVNLEKGFGDFTLKTDFQAGGETFGILGASGSGKSITLRCIAGLTTPTKGKIILNDRVLFDSEKKINVPARKRNIGYLFQNYALFPHLTVEQNIAFGIRHLAKKEQQIKIDDMLEMIQLKDLGKRYPHQLSGGQQQRVALARALVTNPEALLLDEPFSALDNHLRRHMEQELIEILKAYKGVTLFVTHNLEEVYRVSKRIMIMDRGKVIANQERDTIFLNPPTFMAAKLTGCKNLAKVKILDSANNDQAPENFYCIEAIEWGNATLQVPTRKLEHHFLDKTKLAYVGIRAHHIQFVSEEYCKEPNVYPCRLLSFEEGPHQITAYIQINDLNLSSDKVHLQVIIYKEHWNMKINKDTNLYVHLPPERLFLTTI